MSQRSPLSRRAFLRGAKGVAVSLPFLEAMLPSLASAATGTPRLVAVYGGVPTYFGKLVLPVGPLATSLFTPISSLAAVRQHVSVITNLSLPVYAKGTTPPLGGCVQQQHGCAQAPLLGGMPSYDSKPTLFQTHTIDQVFADDFGATTKFKSIQARVQAAGYGYGATGGIVSSRFENGVSNSLAPTESPLGLFTKLFSGVTGATSPSPAVSQQVLNRRSVLDLVLSDANRLISNLSGSDKIRMEQHFSEIRDLEKRIASTNPLPTAGSCAIPATPPADPSVNNVLGGWASEAVRGDLMADILALALACDLTRAVSWQLTFDQCGLSSEFISGVKSDLHAVSHDVNNDTTGVLKEAMYKHLDWHCARFAKLVAKLASLPEGTGSVLDNTFLGMGFGEGVNAHNRTNLHMFIAGNASRMKLGECIAGNMEHPAKLWVAGLNGLGVNRNNLGQISGSLLSILK